ncbi:MAG: HAD-IIA family hydrolase [Anaerolineales bacterium]|jgi:4-nitrophenyl phosphatase
MFNLQQIKGLILDMDGVLWRGSVPIGDLVKIFARIKHLGIKITLATNNSGFTVATYQQKLANFGVDLDQSQIISSGVVAAAFLKRNHPNGGEVYIIGGDGLFETLADQGFEASNSNDVPAVVVGLDREINYEKIKHAARLIRNGALFIGTNPDNTYPDPDGLSPGTGSILAAVGAAAGVRPKIMGKPETEIVKICLERMNISSDQALVVGDRLETDIECGQRLAVKTALVLSGVTTRDMADNWQPPIDWIGESLETLVFDGIAG